MPMMRVMGEPIVAVLMVKSTVFVGESAMRHAVAVPSV
jgi:hypothetical protein